MKREERLRFLAQWREARERDAEAEASGLTRQDRIALPVGHRLRLGPPA